MVQRHQNAILWIVVWVLCFGSLAPILTSHGISNSLKRVALGTGKLLPFSVHVGWTEQTSTYPKALT